MHSNEVSVPEAFLLPKKCWENWKSSKKAEVKKQNGGNAGARRHANDVVRKIEKRRIEYLKARNITIT